MKILLYGGTGWIGGRLISLLEADNELFVSKVRLEDYVALINELEHVKPTHVINAAGLTGRPNVDWCEDHKVEVIRVNVIAASIIADYCHRLNIHYTYVGTGCIFEYDDKHQIGGQGFTKEDKPNFDKSFYSYSKIMTEAIARQFDNALILRVRMPLSDDLHPRNFITKITKYEKVVNIPNSMTILHDLIPLIPDMVRRGITGIYNFTNPGVISHNQILDLYKQYIDHDFTYVNFSLDDQAKILKAGRSNNELDSSKLLSLYPDIPHIRDGIISLFERMAALTAVKETEVK
jgi:dTDP-4-dehydrorhamnose reductase